MDMVIKTQQVKNDPLWKSNYGFFSWMCSYLKTIYDKSEILR
jgi:hypothetical protein